jgi:hypothetical protein
MRLKLALGAVVVLIASVGSVGTVSAQDFFSALFGGLFRGTRSETLSYADPQVDIGRMTGVRNGTAFCVRLCDGRYFPVTSESVEGGSNMCSALCPAAKTAIFHGGEIDDARAGDGTRYDEISNAYVYRAKIVEGCTCNGKTAFGLAAVDINADPTLRAGDLVVAADKLTVFLSRNNRSTRFSPVASSEKLRDAYNRHFATRSGPATH